MTGARSWVPRTAVREADSAFFILMLRNISSGYRDARDPTSMQSGSRPTNERLPPLAGVEGTGIFESMSRMATRSRVLLGALGISSMPSVSLSFPFAGDSFLHSAARLSPVKRLLQAAPAAVPLSTAISLHGAILLRSEYTRETWSIRFR